jgi:hypothetical protein
MQSFKDTLRKLIQSADHTKCAEYAKCQCKSKCCAFVPSAELYAEVTRLAKKEVK